MWFWRPRGDEQERRPPVGAEAAPPVSRLSDPPPSSQPPYQPLDPPPRLDPPPPPAPPTGQPGRRGQSAIGSAQAPPGIMHATRGLVSGPLIGVAAPGGVQRPTRLSREVGRLLASLGKTRGDVATALEAAGVRAVPRDPRRTPVSLFLSAVIGADPNVRSVTVDGQRVAVELRAWWRSDVVVDLPPVIGEFLAAFDECCYPALLPPGHGAEGPGHRSD